MNKFLASVNCLAEAQQVLAIGVDIIDLKQPAQGALGALDLTTVRTVVTAVNGQCLVSATVGDLPMQPDLVYQAVAAMQSTGVDYIKIGFFPGGDWPGTLARLVELTAQGMAIVAVLFADHPLDLSWLPLLKQAGFRGVMLDTQDKQCGSLTHLLSTDTLTEFVATAYDQQLICGLAGSLRLTDVPALIPLQADYLGFRGALCTDHQRTASIDPAAICAIKQALQA